MPNSAHICLAPLLQLLSPLRNCIVAICLLHLSFLPPAPVNADDSSPVGYTRSMLEMLSVIRDYGLTDHKILHAMQQVPRHKFVPARYRKYSYQDTPLDIGYGQTISQPYIVAEMTRQLHLSAHSKVLEIGTGSGYQAAVLAEITPEVYSIEVIESLHKRAKKTLKAAGYPDVHLRHADGYHGWPEAAPFDAIIVTCAAGHIPPPLLSQLARGGRMIIPVGKRFGTQYLILIAKDLAGTITSKNIMAVRFVPLVRK